MNQFAIDNSKSEIQISSLLIVRTGDCFTLFGESHQILHHSTDSQRRVESLSVNGCSSIQPDMNIACCHARAPDLSSGRGDRPSQTTRLTRSLPPIQADRLEFKQNKGGISLVTPWHLAAPLQCLPPILHMICPNPMLRYSKASRGLSVHMRVTGVFTGTTISPSPWSRQ